MERISAVLLWCIVCIVVGGDLVWGQRHTDQGCKYNDDCPRNAWCSGKDCICTGISQIQSYNPVTKKCIEGRVPLSSEHTDQGCTYNEDCPDNAWCSGKYCICMGIPIIYNPVTKECIEVSAHLNDEANTPAKPTRRAPHSAFQMTSHSATEGRVPVAGKRARPTRLRRLPHTSTQLPVR